MMTGQPPGGGVPFGITTVNGICGVSITIGVPLPSRVKRSSVVSQGTAQVTKPGGIGRSPSAPSPFGIVRLEARAAVVAGRDRLHVVVRIVATEERRELRVGVEDQLGPAREVGARHREAGQHHLADLEHVVGGGLGGEHGHAGDGGGRRRRAPPSIGHDGIEDRVRVAVGAGAVAHALPVGRRLDRLRARIGHRRR